MALASRPQIKYSLTDNTEQQVKQAVADHDKFVFATITITNAANASNFAADKYIALVDNKGTTLGYVPVKAAAW